MPYDLDCAAIHVLLLPMIHSRLTPTLEARVHDHLQNCIACRQDYEELQALQQQTTRLIEQLPPAPDRLWSKLQLAMTPEPEPKAETLSLLSSCLNFLSAAGIPPWATEPVSRSIDLAKDVRDGRIAARIHELSHLGMAGND